ncbi:MAG: PstS family phosphate ABC transporter substrate-binding protein [Planctomycetota bacterium]
MRIKRISVAAMASFVIALSVASCGKKKDETGLSGSVAVDGSSTVFPITEAVAEEFQKINPNVRVLVGVSGTGGGFKKFVLNETDINDASRPIKSSEADQAKEKGIEYIELPVAYDGISVVINPKNDFIDFLTVEELKKIWQPDSAVKLWSDVRPNFPAEPIKLYGPGTDSGTFDYFTEHINGKSGACRPDFTASEDDNTLVHGVAGDKYSLGFFGFSYYAENAKTLKAVPIKLNSAAPAVAPSFETINNSTYVPLSRPVFIYVNKASVSKPHVDAFITFYLENAKALSKDVGNVSLSDEAYAAVKARYVARTTGSSFAKPENAGKSVISVLKP